MSLSPEWVPALLEAGFEAVHWSELGRGSDPDQVIYDWAVANRCVVFTHDLDFGTLLAHSRQPLPSVVLIRGPRNMPEQIGEVVRLTLREHRAALEQGALLVYRFIK